MFTLKRERPDKVTLNCPVEKFNQLKTARLKGCPFIGYSAFNLLSDLVAMYSWKMEYNRLYTVGDFLDLCNDEKAVVYRGLFVCE